jgi:hypothetical protein
MSGLCKYSNALGEPGKGAHSLRVGGLAVVDLLGTAALTFLITRYALHRSEVWMFVLVFVLLILVAVLIHEAFCVNTRLNAVLFERDWPGPGSQPAKTQ